MLRYLFALCAAFALPAPASAADIDNVTNLDIVIGGSIGEHCALGDIADMDFGNLERTGLGAEARVAFECNVPFTMTITGRNGALAHTAMPNGQGPYAGALPYSLSVRVPVRHPETAVVTETFESRQIRAGGTISSNGGVATDNMVVAVELGAPSSPAGLLAGDYSETITITVSPT